MTFLDTGYEAYPHIHYDRSRHRALLQEPFRFKTDFKGRSAQISGASLHPDGTVIGHHGYEWDLGTGAVETMAMVVSSLQHDILTDMIYLGVLPEEDRDTINELFRKELMYWSRSRKFEKHWSWARWAAVASYGKVKGIFR